MRFAFTALTVSGLLALSAFQTTVSAAPMGRANLPLLVGTSPYELPASSGHYQGLEADDAATDQIIRSTDVQWGALPPLLER